MHGQSIEHRRRAGHDRMLMIKSKDCDWLRQLQLLSQLMSYVPAFIVNYHPHKY